MDIIRSVSTGLVPLAMLGTAVSSETFANLAYVGDMTIDPDTGELWVDQYQEGSFAVLNPGTGQLLRTIQSPTTSTTKVAFAGQTALFTAEYGNAIYAVDKTTGQSLYTIKTDGVNALPTVRVSPTGQAYYLQSYVDKPGTIVQFDPANGAVLRTATTAGMVPRGLVFSGDGRSIYTVNESGTFDVLDAATLQVTHQYATGTRPRDLVVTNGTAFVSNFGSGDVTRVNLATGTTSTIKLGWPWGEPKRIAVNGGSLLVGLAGTNQVKVVSMSTGKVTQTWATNGSPRGIIVNNGKVFVANGHQIAARPASSLGNGVPLTAEKILEKKLGPAAAVMAPPMAGAGRAQSAGGLGGHGGSSNGSHGGCGRCSRVEKLERELFDNGA